MREPSDEMPKQYSPTESEARWYEFWETSGYFAASEDPDDQRPTYTLAIPPPNVRPLTPVVEITPPVVASPYWWVAWSRSPH